MKGYEVTVSWQPNINRLDRSSKTFRVTARSQPAAIFQAAYQMGWDQVSYLRGSETIEVKTIGSVW
jgi:hypothetical protein